MEQCFACSESTVRHVIDVDSKEKPACPMHTQMVINQGGHSAFQVIPAHEYNENCEYLKSGSCYFCCERCNYDEHRCHFCGDDLDHFDRMPDGSPNPCYVEADRNASD